MDSIKLVSWYPIMIIKSKGRSTHICSASVLCVICCLSPFRTYDISYFSSHLYLRNNAALLMCQTCISLATATHPPWWKWLRSYSHGHKSPRRIASGSLLLSFWAVCGCLIHAHRLSGKPLWLDPCPQTKWHATLTFLLHESYCNIYIYISYIYIYI